MTSQHLTVLAARDSHAPLIAARTDTLTTTLFEDRDDLAHRFLELATALPERPRTLDFVGLTGADKLLTFHGRPVDTRIGRVRALFRELVEQSLLARLGVTSVRLVGCLTAAGEPARRSLAMISEIIGMEAVGTTELVSAADFTSAGFVHPAPRAFSEGLFLDLDARPALPLAAGARALTLGQGRDVLALIRRDAGAAPAGLLALPQATLALPAGPDRFHHLELLLDHELVRAGDAVFQVEDPRALRAIVEPG